MAFNIDVGTSAREKFKFFQDNIAWVGPGNDTAPIGVFVGGQYNLVAPTYTDGDPAVLQFTSSGLLKTDATFTVEGDINIGSVEIKDAESDTRVKVKTDGTDNAMVVTQNVLPALTVGDAIIGQVKLVDDDGNLVDVTGGRLHVEMFGVNVVSIAGHVPGVEASQLGKAEDAVHGSGDVGVMSLVVRNDSLASLVGDDGDYAPLQVNSSGALFVDASSTTITVDTELPAAASITDTFSNPTTTNIMAMNMGWDSTNSQWERLKTDTAGIQLVQQTPVTGANPAVFNDNAFVTGDSPVTLDINAALSRNAKSVSIAVTGAGAVDIEYSFNNSSFTSKVRLTGASSIELTDVDIDAVRLTWIADSAYAVVAY